MEKQSYVVEGMTCSGCERTVSRVIGNIEGVKSSAADHTSSRVTVEFDPAKVDAEKIRKAVSSVGYTFVGEAK